jgi:type II secretion system (T2SS) protein M
MTDTGTSNGGASRWKQLTWVALGLLLVADLGLAGFLWVSAREGPQAMRTRRDRLAMQARLLRSDVQRGEKVRAELPQAGKDCDAFYHKTFMNAATAYSQVEADLTAIAAKAGVKTSELTFKPKEIKDRGVTEIQISTSLDADYPAVIKFIDELERSTDFYLLDSLQLTSATPGSIKLGLQLHTYFRS